MQSSASARLTALLVLALALTAVACSGGSDLETDQPRVVATTPILGAVASATLGDRVDVVTIMPNGTDPHAFSAAAPQADEMLSADLLVVNGGGLEEGLADLIDQAREAGVPTFTAADHAPGGPDADDPHFWLDPVAMQEVVEALGAAVEDELDIDATDGVETFVTELAGLDARNEAAVATVPTARRKLVTGHDALGWWAARYGFEVIGLVIPSTSTQAETSAGRLADLARTIEDNGVNVIFAETGQSLEITENLASDTGARVVELDVETLPDDGSYVTLIEQLTERIASNLR